jgi:hypothetical protein
MARLIELACQWRLSLPIITFNFGNDLIDFGIFPRLQFGMDLLAVHRDFKCASLTWNKFQRGDVQAKMIE